MADLGTILNPDNTSLNLYCNGINAEDISANNVRLGEVVLPNIGQNQYLFLDNFKKVIGRQPPNDNYLYSRTATIDFTSLDPPVLPLVCSTETLNKGINLTIGDPKITFDRIGIYSVVINTSFSFTNQPTINFVYLNLIVSTYNSNDELINRINGPVITPVGVLTLNTASLNCVLEIDDADNYIQCELTHNAISGNNYNVRINPCQVSIYCVSQ